VSRSLVIFIAIVLIVVGAGYWGLPYFKQKIFGTSMQTQVTLLSAEEDYEVKLKTTTVSRMVISIEIIFPLNGAPEKKEELVMIGDDGKPLRVDWTKPEKQDDFDKGTTRWTLRESFFPIDFRSGMLRNQYKDLGYIRVPQVPYNIDSKKDPN
jgi:hypothetical protein